MSNRTGRRWYRLSSIVRPTPYSSRDPSPPRNVIEPPTSPTASSSFPPSPRSPPKNVRETKPSPDLSSPELRHERVTTRQEIITYSAELFPAAQSSHPPPPQPMFPPLHASLQEKVQETKPTPITSSRSIKQEPPNPKQEHETTHQKNIVTLPKETNLVQGPNETLSSEFDGDVLMDTQEVITISSENKGAVMEILRSLKKKRGPFSFDKSVDAKPKPKNHIKKGGNCFVNSNVQMVNGSVVYNSSESHHDPGVNLSLYRIPSSSDGYIIKDHGNGYNSSTN